MDRFALFTDAGYFFAAGAQATFGKPVSRRNLSIKDPEKMLSSLVQRGREIGEGTSFLRVYWYDAMPGPRLSLEQSQLALLSGVKVRLGALNSAGEQKGVDSLIVTDLIELARNGAISDAILVSGDEDLRIAVQLAQSFGVRVHILAAGDPTKNVSPTLQMEADSVTVLSADWFAEHLQEADATPTKLDETSLPAHQPLTNGDRQLSFEAAAEQISNELLDEAADQLQGLKQHFENSQSVPPEYDRRLIAKTSKLIGRLLQGDDKRRIRGVFVRAVRARSP